MRPFVIATIAVVMSWVPGQDVAALTFNFAVNDGGFTTSLPELGEVSSWSYSGTRWETTDIDSTSAYLVSPEFTATGTSPEITLEHAYNFEEVGDFIDGGRLEVSVNNGSYQIVTPNGGYPVDDDGVDIFAGIGDKGWGGFSNGEVTDTATLSVGVGDMFRFRFHAAWDVVIHPETPNWFINSIAVTQVPEPCSGLIYLVGLIVVANCRVRPHRRKTR